MATAAHYRKLAEECFEWAHEARDVGVRQHYAKLCQIWLECAARADVRAGVMTPPEPIIQKVAWPSDGFAARIRAGKKRFG